MAKQCEEKVTCPNCRPEDDCFYAKLLRETDLGILQQEACCDRACWRDWIRDMGVDPDRLIERLQLPERSFGTDRTLVVRALLHLLEPADRVDARQPYIQSLPSYSLLFAKDRWGEGYFLVGQGYRNQDVLDVDQYDRLIEEARIAGVQPPYHVFAQRQQFTSPNLHFLQLGICEIRRLIHAVNRSA